MTERISDKQIAKACGAFIGPMARELQQLRDSHKALVEALEPSRKIVDIYRASNPKYLYRGVEQDPMGAHALLPKIDAALDGARKVGE